MMTICFSSAPACRSGAAGVYRLAAGIAAILCHVALLPAEAATPPTEMAQKVEAASDRDVVCMARNVYFEARGESETGMLAVGQVVVNRARDVRPVGARSFCAIVGERRGRLCQFSWVCGHHLAIREPEAWRRSLAVAHVLADQGHLDEIDGATFFGACRVTAGWARDRQMTAHIGPHCFYRSR